MLKTRTGKPIELPPSLAEYHDDNSRRVLRPGDIVRGQAGLSGLFRIMTISPDGAFTLYGGKNGHRSTRVVTIDKIGVRKALAGSKKAADIWKPTS